MNPKLNVHVFNFRIPVFPFYGVLGIIGGVFISLLIGSILGISLYPIFIMTIIVICCFIFLTIASKILFKNVKLVFFQHLLFSLLICWVYLTISNSNILDYLDLFALGFSLFLVFGRIGCYNVGCCHGRINRFGVSYGRKHVEHGFASWLENVKLFPIQIVESITAFNISVLGIFTILQGGQSGTFYFIFLLLYSSCRFVYEFLRGDRERFILLDFSEAQWTAFFIIISNTFLLVDHNYNLLKWHVIAILLITSLVIWKIKFQKPSFKLTNPFHVYEIAQCLNALESHKSISRNIPFTIVKTSQGLSLSGSKHRSENELINHYTVSLDKSSPYFKKNPDRIVLKVATLIQQLKYQKCNFHCQTYSHNVYHLFYS